jgi:hypothetical protein
MAHETKTPPEDEPGRRFQNGLWRDQRRAENPTAVTAQHTPQPVDLQDIEELPARFRNIIGLVVADPSLR